jgi:hypothetical protein
MIIEILRTLKTHYGDVYDAIVAITTKPSSVLTYFYYDGAPEEIKTYKEMGSYTYGSIFINENWDEHMNMVTVANIGYFIIRYIEKFKLDLGVGTGGNKHHPQIVFLPNKGFDCEATPQEIETFEKDAQRNLKQLNGKFKLDFCS